MKKRDINQINKRIDDGEANIYTAEEFKKLIKEDNAPSFDEVDVVTTGTCGVMSGTAAILNFIVSEPGEFIRADKVYLNGVPAYAGPCPNEWLGEVDVILHGTSHSINDEGYGGGFLLKDIMEGKSVDVRVESVDGKTIENTITKSDINRAQIIGSRMAFKNYTAFTNPNSEAVSSIFAATPLEGNLSGLTFSGCGDLNPLENDLPHNVIKTGKKVLLNDAEAFILGDGTRSNPQKPNLMLSGDLTQMDSYYFGGFKTGQGGEIFNTVAIPIPVLNEEIYNNLLICDSDVTLPVADIKGRHLPLAETNYYELWGTYDLRPQYDRAKCSVCDSCEVENVCPTNAFSNQRLDLSRCFGCGMCANFCSHDAFDMNTGSVDLKINEKDVNIPIICRQSDRLRANKLSLKLKKMIKSGEFKL
ncbi:methanogenesis marker 16 metalloprotein [Methanobrevibacter millerae]|uniref:methanogenesis marker 16 metalloprotein n=1 Tax=Methanobrevibacter millerae TaxID=230361 RepID=UPI000736BAB0|nr:methanogenesis marker 16 metalloprotein [Methanobrevibacter millerae]MBO6109926.1 methanogenesis marker 16 metalloprotein [Methanobrevibacter sp.]MBP3226960.1 methanogenesis marker 16 metalloprotein [Methanobrevibacter sp.]